MKKPQRLADGALRCLGLLLLVSSLESTQFEKAIYHYLPEKSLSYCSRKLNASHQIGCSSKLGGSVGVLWIANQSDEVSQIVSKSENIVLAVDLHLFTNTSLMHEVRSSVAIAGLLVFASSASSTPPMFSESSDCPNAPYSLYGSERQCNVTPSWNPPGSEYALVEWPFPVVLIQDPNSTLKVDLSNCFQQFNAQPLDDSRCAVEINNGMSAVHSTTVCNRRQYLMSLQPFKAPDVFCDELTGVNIVLSTSNTSHHNLLASGPETGSNLTARAPNSSLVVLTRMDARSMFERSGFGSQGVLPGVAVLLSTAVHLLRQPAFKNSQLKRDLFFVFLDNEAYDFMGSGRLHYDLREELLSRYTGYPLGWDHIYGLIELGELGLPSNKTQPSYYMLTDDAIRNQTSETTDRLMNQFIQAAERQGQLEFRQATHVHRSLPLPPTASLQFLLSKAPGPLAHLLLSDYVGPPMADQYFESLLDTRWPPVDNPEANQMLLNLANSLADALHAELTVNSSPIPEKIVFPTPGDLLHCFIQDANCSLFRLFLSPSDIQFLVSLNSPLPTQTYLPLGEHELKLSHLVSVLLMGLTGELTEQQTCPENTAQQPYVYLMGYFNGSAHCYRTMLDLATRFVLFRRGEPIAPGWVRSRLASATRYLRWYRTSSPMVDNASLVLGILLIIMAAASAFQLRHLMDIHANRSTTSESIEPVSSRQPTSVLT